MSRLISHADSRGCWPPLPASSVYNGVEFDEHKHRWRASVTVMPGNSVALGYFDSEIAAARAYDAALRFPYRLTRVYALNFPAALPPARAASAAMVTPAPAESYAAPVEALAPSPLPPPAAASASAAAATPATPVAVSYRAYDVERRGLRIVRTLTRFTTILDASRGGQSGRQMEPRVMHVGRGFARPVTEIYRRNAEFCAEYSAIIAEPMDLGTIGERLQREFYGDDALKLYGAFELIVRNCRAFNSAESVAGIESRLLANALEGEYDRLFAYHFPALIRPRVVTRSPATVAPAERLCARMWCE